MNNKEQLFELPLNPSNPIFSVGVPVVKSAFKTAILALMPKVPLTVKLPVISTLPVELKLPTEAFPLKNKSLYLLDNVPISFVAVVNGLSIPFVSISLDVE